MVYGIVVMVDDPGVRVVVGVEDNVVYGVEVVVTCAGVVQCK